MNVLKEYCKSTRLQISNNELFLMSDDIALMITKVVMVNNC